MRETYAVILPPAGIVDVRKAATQLDPTQLAEQGLTACRVYFPGTSAILQVEGESDLLDRLRGTKSGESLMRALDEHAWFTKLATPLTPIMEAGTSRGAPHLTAVGTYGVTPLHEAALARDLHEIRETLADGPHLEFLSGNGLTIHFEVDDISAVDDVLHGDFGSALQHVLHDHTGFKPGAWRDEVAIEVAALHKGLLSSANYGAPLEVPTPKGMWGPAPTYEHPRGG